MLNFAYFTCSIPRPKFIVSKHCFPSLCFQSYIYILYPAVLINRYKHTSTQSYKWFQVQNNTQSTPELVVSNIIHLNSHLEHCFVCIIWEEGKQRDIYRFNLKESCPKTFEKMQYCKHHAPQHLDIEYLNMKNCQFSSFK